MDLNKVQIIGNITQDIEMKQTPNGQNVTTITVATNRKYTDNSGTKQENAEYHSVVLWGKLREIVHQYLHKGSKLYIEGRLQTRSWEAQDGTKRYKTEIVGENIIMLGSKGGSYDSYDSAPSYDNTPSSGATKKSSPTPERELSIEDIPF